MTTVQDIYNAIDRDIPFSAKESWDNCGLLAGCMTAKVTKIVTALDITRDVIKEAADAGAELIVSHHPVIFTPLKAIDPHTPAGMLIKNGINAVCTHTPFDMAERGMNKGLSDILEKPLGLKNPEPLDDMGNGMSVGMIYGTDIRSPKEAAERAKNALGCKCVRFTEGREIRKIAICSGSGGSYMPLAEAKGADALLTGDIKHDVFIDGVNRGFTLIDCGHYYTERIFCGIMAEILRESFPDINVITAESCTDPAGYII